MGRHRRSGGMGDVLAPVMIISVLLGVVIFIYLYGASIGFTAEMASSIIALIPSMFGLIVSTKAVSEIENSTFVVAGVLGLGVTVGYTIYALHTIGVFTDATFLPSTMQNSIVLVIVFFAFLAGVAYAMLRR